LSLDYVSVLAGGECDPTNTCYPLCVGRKTAAKIPAHFADRDVIYEFLKLYRHTCSKLSISGSSSDPMLVPRQRLAEVIAMGHGLRYKRITLHTCLENINLDMDLGYLKWVHGIVVSVHSDSDSTIWKVNKLWELMPSPHDVRFSFIAHSGNVEKFNSVDFWSRFPPAEFTIRKNVFEPSIEVVLPNKRPSVLRVYNQKSVRVYAGGMKQDIVVWDYKDANKHIEARYLWPNGEIKRQCYWGELH